MEKTVQDVLAMIEDLSNEEDALKLYEIKCILKSIVESSHDLGALRKVSTLIRILEPDVFLSNSSTKQDSKPINSRWN